jgi:hypothetical protein
MAGVEAKKSFEGKERGLEGNVSKRQGDRHHVNELDQVRFAYGNSMAWSRRGSCGRHGDGQQMDARFYGKGIGLTLLITAAA